MDKISAFKQIVTEMSELYENKNNDYGDSFTQTAEEFGLVAPVIRLSDKLNRIKSLLNSAYKTNEKLEDTLIDLANYAIMTVMWIRNYDLSSE